MTAQSIQVNYVEAKHPISWNQTSTSTHLVTSLRSDLDVLQDDNLTHLLQTFDATNEIDSKHSIASSILHKALNLATQTVVNLDIGALLIIQVNKLSSSHLKVQPQDSTLCFSTVNEHVIQPGQSLSLHLDALTNYPPAPSNVVYHLHDDLPVYFNFFSTVYSEISFHQSNQCF